MVRRLAHRYTRCATHAYRHPLDVIPARNVPGQYASDVTCAVTPEQFAGVPMMRSWGQIIDWRQQPWI